MAKTSFSKSMVMQALLYLVPNAVIIIILPLNVIRLEQVKKIIKLPYIQPVYIQGKTISVKLIKDICIGSYIYILISLELLVSNKLYKVLVDPMFCFYIPLIVVNKVHLLTNQGETFCIAYVQLFKVCLVLVNKPWFIYTVTLNPFIFQTIYKLVKFKPNI